MNRSRIKSAALAIAFAFLAAGAASDAGQTSFPKPEAAPTIASAMDVQLKLLESQLVPAAQAMPEDKYSFAPTNGEYRGVRTFALQVRHVATANFIFYSAILGQAPPPGVVLVGVANGPEEIRTKEQLVKFVQDSFALGHKALATLNAENLVVPLKNPPISFMNTRLALATFSVAHGWDHYGQMAEYLRMNGIVPPGSVGQPPANPPAQAAPKK
jgi:hypothetical protein